MNFFLKPERHKMTPHHSQITTKKTSKERNSAFELARIVCMLLIILQHFVGQSHITINADPNVRFYAVLFGSGARIAVNIFIMISAYFMINRPFKSAPILKIYLRLLFYSVTLSMATFIFFHANHSWEKIVLPFFPFITLALWYVSAHISLMLLSPFLNQLFLLPKKQLLIFILSFLFVYSGSSTFHSMLPVYNGVTSWGEWLLWFILVYLIIGYIKLHTNLQKIRTPLTIIMGLFIWLGLATIRASAILGTLGDSHMATIISRCATNWLYNCMLLPNLIAALLVFIFISSRTPFSSRLINTFSASTLGVYIIHQVPAFYPILWTTIFPTTRLYHSPYLPLYIPFVVLTTFVGASLIDRAYSLLLESVFVKTSLFRKVQSLLDKLYQSS